MFCPKCGKVVSDDLYLCPHCNYQIKPSQIKDNNSESKTGLGVVMAIFLGVIGLIIGICLYPAESYARKSFIKAWCITYAVIFAISIIFVIIMGVIIGSMPGYY